MQLGAKVTNLYIQSCSRHQTLTDILSYCRVSHTTFIKDSHWLYAHIHVIHIFVYKWDKNLVFTRKSYIKKLIWIGVLVICLISIRGLFFQFLGGIPGSRS